MQNRREFLQRVSGALALIGVNPMPALEAATPAVASTVSVIPPIDVMYKALSELQGGVSFLHTGAFAGKKATLAAADVAIQGYRKFWNSGLHNKLEYYTPEQMGQAIIEHISKTDPDILNGDLTPELAADPEMLRFAKEQREGAIRFQASFLKNGLDYAKMTEDEFRDMVMERAAAGYAHWKKIHPNTWQEYERRVEAGEDTSKPYDRTKKPSENAPAELPLPQDATPHEKLEALLASTDVSVTKQGKELQLLSFDEGLIRQAAQIMQQDNMGSKVRAGKLSILVEEPNHTLLSLARPYIQEYSHSRISESPAVPQR